MPLAPALIDSSLLCRLCQLKKQQKFFSFPTLPSGLLPEEWALWGLHTKGCSTATLQLCRAHHPWSDARHVWWLQLPCSFLLAILPVWTLQWLGNSQQGTWLFHPGTDTFALCQSTATRATHAPRFSAVAPGGFHIDTEEQQRWISSWRGSKLLWKRRLQLWETASKSSPPVGLCNRFRSALWRQML